MHQAVATWKDVDEGTELGDVHNTTLVDGTYLSGRRVDDQLDLPLGLGHGGTVGRGDGHDAHHAVVVNADIGTGLGLNGVDHLALGADDLTDLLDRDLEADDLGGVLPHVVARLGDRLGHRCQDRLASLLGLVQGRCQDVGGYAVDLGVQLEGRHEVGRTGNLEVHVAKGVLGPQDVGEGHVLTIQVDEAHGDSGNRSLDRHTGIHHREARRAHRRHRGGAVGRQNLGNEAQRVGELIKGRQDRHEGTLGERTVADLTSLRTPHEAGLSGGVGGEVVVVHVALAVDGIDSVDHLVHAPCTEGGEVEHLCLTPLEQAGTVCGRDDRHIR